MYRSAGERREGTLQARPAAGKQWHIVAGHSQCQLLSEPSQLIEVSPNTHSGKYHRTANAVYCLNPNAECCDADILIRDTLPIDVWCLVCVCAGRRSDVETERTRHVVPGTIVPGMIVEIVADIHVTEIHVDRG